MIAGDATNAKPKRRVRQSDDRGPEDGGDRGEWRGHSYPVPDTPVRVERCEHHPRQDPSAGGVWVIDCVNAFLNIASILGGLHYRESHSEPFTKRA